MWLRFSKGETALYRAVYSPFLNNVDIAKILIDHGADINAYANNGETPFSLAVIRGQSEMIDLLIDYGAVVDEKILYLAIINNHEYILDTFIKQGISLDSLKEMDFNGSTLFEVALEKEFEFLLDVLINDQAYVEKLMNHGIDPLLLSVNNGNAHLIEELLKKGWSIDHKNKAQQTPLMISIIEGNKDIADLLLSYGADLKAQDVDNVNVLMLSSEKGYLDIVKKCINKGLDINSRDVFMKTPLMYAAKGGDAETVKYLIDHGSDINAKADNPLVISKNRTALMPALENKNHRVLELLLENGANMNYLTNNVLIDWTPLMHACHNDDIESLELLLTYGADVKMKNSNGETALIFASQCAPEFPRLLLQHGADVNAKDNSGNSAIMYAVTDNYDISLTKLLIDAGAGLFEKDNSGNSLILRAAEEGNDAQFKYLMEIGADINETNDKGEKAIDLLLSKIEKRSNRNKNIVPDHLKVDIEPEDKSVSFIAYDTAPKMITSKSELQKITIYPEFEKKYKIGGQGVVQAFIDVNGKAKDCIITKAMPTVALNEAMVNAVKMMKFTPAKQRGKNVGVWVNIPLGMSIP